MGTNKANRSLVVGNVLYPVFKVPNNPFLAISVFPPATGKTKIQSVIGIVFMIVSMVVAYIMMAPPDALIPGFNLASTGLAWKMVGIQIVKVNVVIWIISRQFGWKFDWSFQVVSVPILFTLAYLSKLVMVYLFDYSYYYR